MLPGQQKDVKILEKLIFQNLFILINTQKIIISIIVFEKIIF
jgi:hypothetical protein